MSGADVMSNKRNEEVNEHTLGEIEDAKEEIPFQIHSERQFQEQPEEDIAPTVTPID